MVNCDIRFYFSYEIFFSFAGRNSQWLQSQIKYYDKMWWWIYGSDWRVFFINFYCNIHLLWTIWIDDDAFNAFNVCCCFFFYQQLNSLFNWKIKWFHCFSYLRRWEKCTVRNGYIDFWLIHSMNIEHFNEDTLQLITITLNYAFNLMHRKNEIHRKRNNKN